MSVKKVPDVAGETITFKELDGHLYPAFAEETLRGVATFKARPDDVVVCAYPKSGTHWVWEIIRCLLARKTDLPVVRNLPGFIEECPADDMEALPSPRSLNTHYHFERLPPEFFSKKVKIVYITRDPRDVAVSFFHHHKKLQSLYDYRDGQWENYFPLHLTGQVDYGSWFTYTKGWEQGIRDNPKLPVFVTSYETMQTDTFLEVRRLAKFIGENWDDEFLNMVIEKCGFDSMRNTKVSNKINHQAAFYRKGKIGDWKNWFTAAQYATFNDVFEEEMPGTHAYQLYSHTLNN